eukprot:jgi/Ulvmu1/8420/UM042_0127.1
MEGVESCPVTMEHYSSSGPNQPVFLPACGHTFSRVAVRNIIVVARHIAARHSGDDPARGMVRCPMCSTVQPHLRVEDLKPNWDTIRRIEHFKSVKAAEEAAAAAAEVESTGTRASDSSDPQTSTGQVASIPSPLAALQALFDLPFLHAPSTLQNDDLQQLCSKASSASPGSTLNLEGASLSCAMVSSWFAATFLSNHVRVHAPIQPQLRLLDASLDEWGWGLSLPLDRVHLWTLRTEDVSICNAKINLPSDGILVMKAGQKITFYNLTLEGGTFVCVGAGTAATFESVRVTGATIVAMNQARVTLSRCTLTDCPVAVLAHARGSAATLRQCTVQGCAAVAVACDGASVRMTDVVATMPRAGGVAVDARGSGSTVHANGVVVQAPEGEDASARSTARDAAFRGRDGATLEISGCAVTACMGGVDLDGAGTVGEVKGCKIRGSIGDGVVVRGGAAGDLDTCNVIMSGGRGIVAEGLGSNVHAAECAVQGPAGDAVVAADGGAVRAHSSQITGASGGCGAVVRGPGSFAALYDCMLDGNASGVRASEGGIVRAEGTSIARCVTGSGAHAEGQGSAVQLEVCGIHAVGGDGVAAEGGGSVEARKLRVRTAGIAGGAAGAGSCARVTGTGSVVRIYEGSLSRGAGGNVLVELGAEAALHGCEVTAGVAGGGIQTSGQGSNLELRQCRVHGNEGGGLRVGDGARVTAAGSKVADGIAVTGPAALARLESCEVRGMAVQRGGGELVAEGCAFEVRPRDSDDPRKRVALTDCLWGREELSADEVVTVAARPAAQQSTQHAAVPAAAASVGVVTMPMAGAAAVSAVTDERRQVFRVVADRGSESMEESGSVAGGLEAASGLPRVGDLPAAYAPEAAEAAQAEATLAPSAQVRGSAERRDASAARRRRHVFGPFLGGASGGDPAVAAAHPRMPLVPQRPTELPAAASQPNPSGPVGQTLDANGGGSATDLLLPAGTSLSAAESVPVPLVLSTDVGASSGALPAWAAAAEEPAAAAAPAAAVRPAEPAVTGAAASSRTALRWLRVAGRQRSGGRSSPAAATPPPASSANVALSEAAAVAAAGSVAVAARRRGNEVTSRSLDVRPLLLPNPDAGGGRVWGQDSRGGSTDLIDSGAESGPGGPEERASAVLNAASDGAATGGSGTEDIAEVRRRSALVRALQRVRRGRRQTATRGGDRSGGGQ